MQSPALATAVAALLAACPPSLIPQWIQDLNTVVGLIGFAITLVVWWQVKNVRLSFRLRVRIPAITKSLDETLALLDKELDLQDRNRRRLRSTFSSSFAHLEAVLPIAPSPARQAVEQAIDFVAKAMDALENCSAVDEGVEVEARDAVGRAAIQLHHASENLLWG